jgi:hypothetical protein
MDFPTTRQALHDAYLPSPVRTVKKSSFLKLQARWEKGRLQRKNSSDSILDVLGKVTVQNEEDATEITDTESDCGTSIGSSTELDEPSLHVVSIQEAADQDSNDARKTAKRVHFEDVEETDQDVSDRDTTATSSGSDCTKLPKEEVRYPRWDFGKKKSFVPPQNTWRTRRAAIRIQRVARGGMARLHFKIRKLENLLETRDERTQSALAKIAERTEQRKQEFLKQVQKQMSEAERKSRCYDALAKEQQEVIDYLKMKNREERDTILKYKEASRILREQNSRLENSKNQAEGTFWSLNDHVHTIREQHKKLKRATRECEVRIAAYKTSIEEHIVHASTERRIKTLYRHLIGEIAVRLEDSPKSAAIAERVTLLCVALENMEASSSLHQSPESNKSQKKILGVFLEDGASNNDGDHEQDVPGEGSNNRNDDDVSWEEITVHSSEDDASLDEYTVHTMDGL